MTIGEIYESLPEHGWVRHGDVWFTRELTDEAPDVCPQGCGRMTEDPYGGPCKACWDEVPS